MISQNYPNRIIVVFKKLLLPLFFFILFLTLGMAVRAQTPARDPLAPGFTYQGVLDLDGARVSEVCDFQFSLWDAPANPSNQVGGIEQHDAVPVNEGYFTIPMLDFGPDAFTGEQRWLQIAVRCPAVTGTFTTLAPRQMLTAAPYALYALRAGQVPWSELEGVPPGFADGVDDVGLTSVSWSQIQNRPSGLDDGDDDTTYTAGAGLVLDGTQFSARGSPFDNVVVVAKSGGDFTSIQVAIDSITDVSAANPYLVYVAPGVYTEQVTLKPYITLEGAGERATVIRWTGGSEDPFTGSGSATLLGANDATLRFLTVESDGTGQANAVAIHNNTASPAIRHVIAKASDSANNFGIYNENGSPEAFNLTVTATGGTSNFGVYNNNASPTMNDMTVTATGGSYGIGVSNVNSSSPAMNNVTVTAAGGINSYGIQNFLSSSPTMTNVTSRATGGSGNNMGVANTSSSPSMSNVTAIGSGGAYNYGVYNDGSSSPEMDNVIAMASSGTNNYGTYNVNSSSPTIQNSVLDGATNSIYKDGTSTVKVANSQLIGPLSTGLICFNNYNQNFVSVLCP